MKYFYIYAFILSCIIIFVSYFNTLMMPIKESFDSLHKLTFILLGDSILQNNNYVPTRSSIEYLFTNNTNNKIVFLAMDDSKIDDVYNQIKKIPANVNTKLTTIFISVGGNDILSYFTDNIDMDNFSYLHILFLQYTNLIFNIHNKLPNAKIVLFNLYYPSTNAYKKYESIINKWNNMLYNYAKENDYSLLNISDILVTPNDFSFEIEPSTSGGKKIVDAIMANYYFDK